MLYVASRRDKLKLASYIELRLLSPHQESSVSAWWALIPTPRKAALPGTRDWGLPSGNRGVSNGHKPKQAGYMKPDGFRKGEGGGDDDPKPEVNSQIKPDRILF